jgi:general secretion pathway protein K
MSTSEPLVYFSEAGTCKNNPDCPAADKNVCATSLVKSQKQKQRTKEMVSVHRNSRGSALLAVLWLSAVLAAIGFSLASTVRGEAERASTGVDSTRAYYLAAGAVQRAILYEQWGRNPAGIYQFPTGEATVELIPEAAKFNINTASPQDLFRLLENLGVEEERAQKIAMAIADWRSPSQGQGPFDQHYLSISPSFRARHASFEEIEELLLVEGMTPDIYYGSFTTVEDGKGGRRLVPRGGFSDCVSIFGGTTGFDVNSASPVLLLSIGIPPDLVGEIVRRRQIMPLQQPDLGRLAQVGGPAVARLRIGGNSIFTLRATARPRLPDGQLSDLKRTVAAMVKHMPEGYDAPYHILRWYENAWSH